MELQVFVPVPADRLREALADAVRVARAVPGLQQDAGAAPVAGRLKLRVAGHSVTYRGTLAVSPRADGTYAVRADGSESRGAGTVTLSLTLALAPTQGGTTVTVGGTAKADGRLAELPADAVTTAANRLLTRTLETLAAGATEGTGPVRAEDASEPGQQGQGEATEPAPQAADKAAGPEQVEGDSATPGRQAEGKPAAPEQAEAASGPGPHADGESAAPGERAEDEDGEPAPGRQAEAEPTDEKPGTPPPSGFDTEVPPPSLDPETDAAIPDTVPDDLEVRAEPPAEAAHARRTMIGRSAEEVDHAPPRGRYAPVPAPQTVTANPALRWAAPAAAVAVAGAIVVARALRKRH
ncbi:carbon monoxide dehydrogenase [Streptomyces griseoluteus]|uniref:Carbon monoxide dehydrogenase n=1 Tax=Streptomyces griseoluteus TaxID=29306 RepID=A0A4Z1DKB7_STRGP|nr:SRPBCC family protein [Streptomyces griseoluteus]TGN83875.1 carbon monoxide dehydrogenase [Streptomyces griseoluteus]